MRLTQAEFNTIFLALNVIDEANLTGMLLFKSQRGMAKRISKAKQKLKQIQASQSLKHRVQVSNKRRSK